jgi:type IV fimbrial biogenesis protein FimT
MILRLPFPAGITRGLTLLELVVGLAIVAILLSAGVPNWGAFLAEREQRDRADALLESLAQARSEAIKRGTRVGICPAVGNTCASGSEGWEGGWIAFADTNRNGIRDGAETMIARERAAAPGISIHGNRPVADYVSYTSLGQARRIDGALQMGTLTVCRSGLPTRKVVLASSGRVRITEASELCP